MTGIEPAFSAWEADVLPLNYTRAWPASLAPAGVRSVPVHPEVRHRRGRRAGTVGPVPDDPTHDADANEGRGPAPTVPPADPTAPGTRSHRREWLRMGTPRGRAVVAASVLGSGVAFLDGTVVNVALPTIGRDLDVGLSGLQWVVDGYLLTLGSLVVLGGSLGDRLGRRRVFQWGLVGFMVASLACAAAPTAGALVGARFVQGIAAALLVPVSLALVSAPFHPDERGRAIGAWSGLSGVATALGPFVGGWLVDAVSWRFVFLINVPFVIAALVLSVRSVPESRDESLRGLPDVAGAVLLAAGLGGAVYALIEGPGQGWPVAAVVAGVAGLACLGAFVGVELRVADPMVPLGMFASRQFSGANLTTFAVYAALGSGTFFVVLQLQSNLGYSALEAGAALLPVTFLMLAFSEKMGGLVRVIGARLPMTVGPIVAGAGLAVLAFVRPGHTYLGVVLPGALVFGAGLTITVAPLTTAVLAAVDERRTGLASAINNAVARIAGLLAVAVLPGLTGMGAGSLSSALAHGYRSAMLVSAVLAVVGGMVAFATIRSTAPVDAVTHADLSVACAPVGLPAPGRDGGPG